MSSSKFKKILIGLFAFLAVLYLIDFTNTTIARSGIAKIFIVLTWLSLIIASIVFRLSTWFKGWFKPRQKQQPFLRSTDHGSAEWATQEQFISKGHEFFQPGLWIGDGYTRKKQGHLLTVAGSGAGKNACIILPNLLIQPYGSYVVTDLKGENAFITARFQQNNGQRVYILDPWGEQTKHGARHGIPASGFNPFDFIKSHPEEIVDNCALVAYYLVPEKPDVKDPYWDDRARALLKTLLMHIVTDMPEVDHNFWTLYKMVRTSGENWLGLLADMKVNDSLDGLVSTAAEEFIGMDPNGPTLSGIRSNAQNATSIFESPQLRKSLEKSDFNPYHLPDGNVTVYIVLPERYLKTHAAWLRIVNGLCLKAVNANPNKRVNFLLDEFAVMGKMPDVLTAYAFGRGQNITMWAFVQSLPQLKEVYTEDGMNALISNASMLQFFGVKDQYTKEYVSKALGETTMQRVDTSISKSDNGSSTSTSIATFGRSLLTAEEVEKFPDIIVITEGLKYIIRRMGYYQNRYEGLSHKADWLDKDRRKLLKAGKTPEDWKEYFAERADPPPRILA